MQEVLWRQTMQISFKITGDGITVTQALRAHVEEQFRHVLKNCTTPPTVGVILKFSPHSNEASRNTTTVNVRADGKETITRNVTTRDMYQSIREAASLVSDEILKRKEKKVSIPRSVNLANSRPMVA